MKAKIRLMVSNRNTGTTKVLEVQGEVTNEGELSEHEIAGVMFACEFAINNHATAIIGQGVRAHIFLE